MDEKVLILMGIVLVSFTSQALSGFGSIIIAVTLGSHLYPIETLLPMLVVLDVCVNSYLVTRHRHAVNAPFLAKTILPPMGIGFAAGILLFNLLESDPLKAIFGVFVVVIATRELWLALHHGKTRAISRPSRAAYLILGGLIQGIFASGGPPVVYAVSRSLPDKTVFRSTLASVWLILNGILLLTYVATGRLTTQTLIHCAWLAPAVLTGLVAGELLHSRIDEGRFRIVIYCLLIAAGLSILVRLAWGA
jgi:uncharacterized membrane protein YfcA